MEYFFYLIQNNNILVLQNYFDRFNTSRRITSFTATKALEGQKYPTISLLSPMIYYLIDFYTNFSLIVQSSVLAVKNEILESLKLRFSFLFKIRSISPSGS